MDLSPALKRACSTSAAAFLDERVYPSEDGYQEELRRSGNHHLAAAVLEKMKGARRR
ncbi:hypothetical protein BH20ACT21_BH20ACT21_18470 [soil metagenome]